jgi:NifB/MoaA-like Fe-S oxidoreductase
MASANPVGHNGAVRKSIPVRLSAIEEQFASIEKLLKELRKRIENVAEDVRIATGAAAEPRAKRR